MKWGDANIGMTVYDEMFPDDVGTISHYRKCLVRNEDVLVVQHPSHTYEYVKTTIQYLHEKK